MVGKVASIAPMRLPGQSAIKRSGPRNEIGGTPLESAALTARSAAGTLQPHAVAGELRKPRVLPRVPGTALRSPDGGGHLFCRLRSSGCSGCSAHLEPKRGLWAIPGGYLESGETLAEGAARELHEEAGILLPAASLQLYMTGAPSPLSTRCTWRFRATVDTRFCLPGEESLDCDFFSRGECPWDRVAYPEVNNAIVQAYDDLESGEFRVWQAELTASRYELWPVLENMP